MQPLSQFAGHDDPCVTQTLRLLQACEADGRKVASPAPAPAPRVEQLEQKDDHDDGEFEDPLVPAAESPAILQYRAAEREIARGVEGPAKFYLELAGLAGDAKNNSAKDLQPQQSQKFGQAFTYGVAGSASFQVVKAVFAAPGQLFKAVGSAASSSVNTVFSGISYAGIALGGLGAMAGTALAKAGPYFIATKNAERGDIVNGAKDAATTVVRTNSPDLREKPLATAVDRYIAVNDIPLALNTLLWPQLSPEMRDRSASNRGGIPRQPRPPLAVSAWKGKLAQMTSPSFGTRASPAGAALVPAAPPAAGRGDGAREPEGEALV